MANDASERVIPLDVVSLHDSPSDCWVVVYDRVYDITHMLNQVTQYVSMRNLTHSY